MAMLKREELSSVPTASGDLNVASIFAQEDFHPIVRRLDVAERIFFCFKIPKRFRHFAEQLFRKRRERVT